MEFIFTLASRITLILSILVSIGCGITIFLLPITVLQPSLILSSWMMIAMSVGLEKLAEKHKKYV